jgi:hypothetical protein
MGLVEIIINGNGPRFDLINNIKKPVKIFSEETSKFKIYIGEGQPDENVNIWITKTNSNNFQNLIQEMKHYLETMNDLEIIGVDNFNFISISPNMCILISKDGYIKTFQNPEDLNLFILEIIEGKSFA